VKVVNGEVRYSFGGKRGAGGGAVCSSLGSAQYYLCTTEFCEYQLIHPNVVSREYSWKQACAISVYLSLRALCAKNAYKFDLSRNNEKRQACSFPTVYTEKMPTIRLCANFLS
jgi:hypothetical protein